MIVLKESKAVLHLMGLIPGAGVTLPVIIWSLPLITLLLPMISYSIVNIHDVRKATDASYVVAADILCIGQYWCLAAQKKNLLSVLDHLDRLVVESSRGFCANSLMHCVNCSLCCRKILTGVRCFYENWNAASLLCAGNENIRYYIIIDVPVSAIFCCRIFLLARNLFTKCMVVAI